jgi:hypothetical protein
MNALTIDGYVRYFISHIREIIVLATHDDSRSDSGS